MNEDIFSRRGFLFLSAGAIYTTSGGLERQQLEQLAVPEGEVLGLDPDVDGAGILLGPEANQPEPGDGFFEQWQTFNFFYIATDTGGRFSIKTDDEAWLLLDIKVVEYEALLKKSEKRRSV